MFVISLEQFQPVNPALWLRLKPLIYAAVTDPKK
jgi:hypothetical protein